MRRIVMRLTISILMIVVLVAAGNVFYLGGTEGGLQFVWLKAKTYLPAELKVGGVHGKLLSHIKVENIVYQNQKMILTIKSVDVRWNALKLYRRLFVIRDLDVDGLQVNTNLQSAASSSSAVSSVSSQQVLNYLRYFRLEKMDIHQAEIRLGSANIIINGGMDEFWHFKWSAYVPDLHYFLNDLRGAVMTSGTMKGARMEPIMAADLSLRHLSSHYFSIGSLTGTINSGWSKAYSDAGKIRVKDLRVTGYRVPDFILQTIGRFRKGGYQLNAVATLSPANRITAQFEIPKLYSVFDLDQPFHAAANVNVKDFSQFNILFKDVPEVRQVDGLVTGSFRADGTILHPVIDGGLVMRQGSVFILSAKRRMTDVNIDTHYRTGGLVTMSGTFKSGEGDADFNGTFGIEDASLPLQIKLRSNNLTAVDTKEYQMKISPDIQLFYHDNDLLLTGRVDVPYADIAPVDFSTTETLPSDVIIVNSKSPQTVMPTNVTMQVRVVLGDQVTVKYRQLQSRLHGAVTLTGMEGRPLTATGEFNIDSGTYRAYGRDLNISQGRLIYAGNFLMNPGINLRASQTIKTLAYTGERALTVGVLVSGTLDKPRLTLFSDNANLSQGDILSYLLLGYPQSQASGASSLALINMAAQATDHADTANPLANLQQKLGLGELNVGSTEYFATDKSETQSATTVNVGRNLGSKLSLHYSIGLFQQIQVFSLRYQLGRHFAVQTETSTLENGGDLLYQLESAH